MTKHFEQLSAEERATIMVMAQEGQSLRAMARTLHRAPSTISREWRRHRAPTATPGTSDYDAKRAGQEARRCRFQPRTLTQRPLSGAASPWLATSRGSSSGQTLARIRGCAWAVG